MIISVLISGIFVLLVSIGFIAGARKKYNFRMRWIWIGGCIWFVGVALKFGFAALANDSILFWLQDTLKYPWYLTFGSAYIGALTGIFEIGITLVFALMIKKMSDDPGKAIGVGVGAGTIEAILIGLSQIANVIYLMTGGQGSNEIMNALTDTVRLNPVFFLLAPAERMIAIICHTGSRVMTLYAVARRNYWFFVIGFLIMTVIDAIAGFTHLSGLMTRISTWWIELLLLPFALLSIPLTVRCIKNWPRVEKNKPL